MNTKKALESVLNELFEIEWLQLNKKCKENKWYPDYKVKIKWEKGEHDLIVEVKSTGEPRIIAEVAGRFKAYNLNGYPVLIAPFVSSRGREMCKELEMGFIDLAGNAHLKFDGVLIERWGKKSEKKEKRNLKNLFSTKSTWVIRRMLLQPKRTWKFEELAEEANVSLGQAYKVVNKLVSEGYVEKKRGATTLLKPGELLDTWTKVYNFQDQDITGYYCEFKEQKILKELENISSESYALTLGSAASLIAPYVRSTDFHLYAVDQQLIIDHLNLKPVEFGGNVYLVKPSDEGVLFDTRQIEGINLVSDIQLYLDLYNYPMRGREQAEHLREEVMEV